MPARSIGTATISFGLVSVPIHIYSTGEPAGSVSFNMVHKDCGTKLKQYYKCPKHDVTVERSDTVKGYAIGKDQFVIFTPEELKALEEKGNNSIEIKEFIPLAKVDRIYLEKAYYLGPDKGGDRPYRLLAEALEKTGRAALGQYAARGHQNLVLVRPMNGVLVMEQLHYSDELRSSSEVPLGEGEVKPAELNLAVQIVEQSAVEDFKPEKYHDTVRERVQEEINKKIEGQEITAEEVPQKTGAKVLDLMEALKASLAKGAPKKESAEKPERPAKKKAAGGR
ncbi:MAG TPA: Ku protein [Gemmatimonadales bacterium]|jgi:DNA end-binding protein Ku|nr:Ku protein [Gemmatimonadales bacterium]